MMRIVVALLPRLRINVKCTIAIDLLDCLYHNTCHQMVNFLTMQDEGLVFGLALIAGTSRRCYAGRCGGLGRRDDGDFLQQRSID